MKRYRMYGVLAPVVLLAGLASAGADQYGERNYSEGRERMEQGMHRDSPQQPDEARGARGPLRGDTVECKDSILCQQKNPGWTERSGYLEPLRVDPSTGMRPGY